MDYFKLIVKNRILIFICILFIFLAFTVSSINKPFMIDEVAYVESAKGVLNEAIPVRYYGEQVGNCLALEHPPLYSYLLALSFKIFGVREFSARLVSILCGVCVLFLIYLLCLEIFKNGRYKYAIALASSLIYAINPLVIQSSLLVDVDSSILAFVLFVFIYIFIKYNDKNSAWKILLLGILIGLIWWTKFQGVFLIVASMIIFYIVNRNIKKGLTMTFLITAIGTSLFLITWWLYTHILNLPFATPFVHNFLFARAGYNTYALLLGLWSAKNLLFWTTPPFLILVALFFIQNLTRYFSNKKISALDYIFLFGAINLCFFLILRSNAFGYPKYFATMMPAFSIIAGYFIVCFALRNKDIKKLIYPITFLVIILLIFNFLFLKDPFIKHNIFYTQSITLDENFDLYIISTLYGLLYFAPLLIAFVFFLVIKKSIYDSAVMSLVITLLVLCVYIDFVQADAQYSTTYAYGQKGVIETGNYIYNHTSSNDTIVAPLTIGYYSKRKYFRSYPDPGDLSLEDIIYEYEISYIVMSPSEKLSNFSDYYKLEAEYGSFKIYRKVSSDIPIKMQDGAVTNSKSTTVPYKTTCLPYSYFR